MQSRERDLHTKFKLDRPIIAEVIPFLVACTRLYKSLCPSVRWLVRHTCMSHMYSVITTPAQTHVTDAVVYTAPPIVPYAQEREQDCSGKMPLTLQDHGQVVSFSNIWVREL